MVQEVLQRRNSLSDPAIANIDQALMVFSLAQPPFEPANATRFLVTAEQAGIPVTLVLNKADLLPPEQLDAVVSKVRHTRVLLFVYASCLHVVPSAAQQGGPAAA